MKRRIVAELDPLQVQLDALKRLQSETEAELAASPSNKFFRIKAERIP